MSSGVSVIIPAFNSVYLREAVASVFSQTVLPSEVIVVDSSPEITLSQIAEYREQIQYFYQPPKGVSAARNFGMRVAHGQYLALLDADDLWLPNKLELQIAAFDLHPTAGFCFSAIWNLCDSEDPSIPQEVFLPPALKQWIAEHGESEGITCGPVYSLLLEVNCIGTSSLMIERKALDAELFDEQLSNAEDYDLELRLAKTHTGIYLHQPVSRYRIHARGLSGSWDSRPQIFYDSNIKVLQKHLRAGFSTKILRALATTYREYARWCFNSPESLRARSLALKSFCLWPSVSTLKVVAESLAPCSYRFICKTAAKSRANT